MRTIQTDALIIGSGFGAAAPALRLSEAGYRVAIVEKGPRIDPYNDFEQTQSPKYLLRYLKGLSSTNLSLLYAEGFGGGSGFYEMICLRAPTFAFELKDETGSRLWPAALNRQVMDPYYERAERMLHVQQIPVKEVPKTGLVFSLMMKRLGYSCDRAPHSVRGCMACGYCVTGCVFGAKESLPLNYLKQAEEAGATTFTELEAKSIRPLTDPRWTPEVGTIRSLPYRYEIECKSRNGSEGDSRFRARIVLLGGGTVGTAELLLGSKKKLGRLSKQGGRNLAFNPTVKVCGLLPPEFPEADMFVGRSHPGMISYEFLESHGIMVTAAKPLPLQAVAAARLRLNGERRDPSHWGRANVELMKLYRHRVMILVAFGATPPGGRIRVRPGGKTELTYEPTAECREFYARTKKLLESILIRNGCRLIDVEFVDREGLPHEDLNFSTAHQLGSCRMADSKERGVVDVRGEVFDYPGLYVSDGAAIPSALVVNPALTILANAERIADGILARHPVAELVAHTGS
jgi:choline dehydrogenase-like flavoprotein